MSPWVKFGIGLVAALAATWISYGPLGQGEALIDRLEARARQRIAHADIPGVEVRMQRDPLSRVAILSGPADDFQREGQGSFPGINERIRDIEGVRAIEWTNPPPGEGN